MLPKIYFNLYSVLATTISWCHMVLITVRNEVVKVMFLQVRVYPQEVSIPACLADGIPACLVAGLWGVCYPSMHCRWHPSMPYNRSPGGVVPGLGVSAPRGLVWGGLVAGGCAWAGGSAPGGLVSQYPLRQTPPGRDGYCCGRYASHWNAFLF